MTMTVMELKALPLGFRFHPTDEELIRHYLKGKITGQINSEVEVIPEIDVCKCEPWDLPGSQYLGSVCSSVTRIGFRWKLGVDEEIFVVDLKKGEVTKGPYQGKPDATFSFTDNDFLGVGTGKTNPQIAFIRGAIKIKGSIAAPQKFTPDIFPKPAKL